MNLVSKLLKLLNIEKENKPWYDLYGNNVPHTLEYPDGSMYDVIKKISKKHPQYKAYVYFGKAYRYFEFKLQIKEAARSLKAMGVEKNDRVTICMPNAPDAIILFYAINAVGAVANMIHPLSSEKEIEFYLNKSESKYMLCLDMLFPKVEKILSNTKVKKVIISKVSNKMPLYMKVIYPFIKKSTKIDYSKNIISWRSFVKLGRNLKDTYIEKRKSSDDAVILYSGGTTGEPKGVVLSNLNFNALATQCFKMTGAKEKDSVLAIMPIFHGFGIGVCVHTPLSYGLTTILVPQFSPNKFSSLIKRNKPTFLAGVPTMYEALINSGETKKNYLKSVKNVICGGDILNETLRDKVNAYLKEFGSTANIRVGYGLTESTAASCLTPNYYFKEGGIGIPLPDMLYKIVKPNSFDEAKPNEDGEICINGPTVMKRYLDDHNETKRTLKRHPDGKIWLHTGDFGCMNEEGLVFFKSRLKRIIVSSGYNIYPQYIEKVIMTHPAVFTCTVIGIDHPYKKQVPKAYIILRENFDDTDDLKNDIKEYCKKSISKYSLPAEYEYVKELPKTLVGKVAFTKLEESCRKKSNGKK